MNSRIEVGRLRARARRSAHLRRRSVGGSSVVVDIPLVVAAVKEVSCETEQRSTREFTRNDRSSPGPRADDRRNKRGPRGSRARHR
jgi:hypothetical protein